MSYSQNEHYLVLLLHTEIPSDILIQTISQARTINKQTNKTLQTYISKAGCCLDDGQKQNE